MLTCGVRCLTLRVVAVRPYVLCCARRYERVGVAMSVSVVMMILVCMRTSFVLVLGVCEW